MEDDWRTKQSSPKDANLHILKTGLFSDCSFAVEDENGKERIFLAHKVLLATASPVFEAMFYGSLPEKNDVPIKITDIEAKAFDKLLHLIYGQETDLTDVTLTIEVYFAADKYLIDTLKENCLEYIQGQITVKSVSEIFVFSTKIGHEDLKEKCIELLKTETFAVIQRKNFTYLNIETFSAILDQDLLTIYNEIALFVALHSFALFELRHRIDGPKSNDVSDTDDSIDEAILNEFRGLVKKIRFCRMSEDAFSAIALSILFTNKERSAIMKCLEDKIKIPNFFPEGFSKSTANRCKRPCLGIVE